MARAALTGPGGHLGFGLVAIDKPKGPTSHAVVDWIRWTTRQRAVGHCGTLDPAATGVLVVCLGAATRLATYLSAADKRYDAVFELGRSTDTADAEGKTTTQRPVDAAQAEAARAQLEALGGAGPVMLPPPAFSAVKVSGRRAHALARAGSRPDLAPRAMEVFEIAGVELGPSPTVGDRWRLRASLRVAKGTYIRSLAEEIERRTAVPAHLVSLRRTASGPLDLDGSIGPLDASELSPDPRGGGPRHRIRPALDGAADRDGGARFVVRGLLDPMRALPFACIDGAEVTEAAPLVARLAMGQRLGLRDPAVRSVLATGLHGLSGGAWGAFASGEPLAELGEGPVAARVGLTAPRDETGRRACVIARVEHAGDRGWRVAPEVVLQDPGPPPNPPKLQRGA